MMRRTRALVFVLLCAVLGPACGGGDPGSGSACVSSDECEDALVCVLGRCRAECGGYRDCPLGSICLEDPEGGAGACRLADEATCESDASCPEGTGCADGRCRARCTTAASCFGTGCASGASGGAFCEEPEETRITCDEESYCGSGICGDDVCDEDLGIALGETITCAVRASGDVDCAGSDADGLLGDGPTEPDDGARPFLLPVVLDEPAQRVAVGAAHGCVVLFTGEVRCWGRADRGQTGAAGAVDFPTLAIDAPADESGEIDEIVLGADHACVRRISGAIECWGSDAAGQLGDETAHAACESGEACSAAPVAVVVTGAIDLDAGRDATCAVRDGGAVACWGRSDTGLLGSAPEGVGTCTSRGASVGCRQTPLDVAGVERAIAVSVGAEHACAIDEDGVVWCWGGNASGQAGAPGGGVVAPSEVELPIAALVVATGRAHTCALTIDDQVWCWGANDASQLGAASGVGGATPARVAGLPVAIDLESGADHACVRTVDNEIWCWGRDAEAQLSDGERGTGGEGPPRRALRSPAGGA